MGWRFYYYLAKDGHSGSQSIGKRQTGLMVVNVPTNEPCSRTRSGGRSVSLIALTAVPVIGLLVEPIAVIAANDGRRLGDRLAGRTQVIAVDDYAPEGAVAG